MNASQVIQIDSGPQIEQMKKKEEKKKQIERELNALPLFKLLPEYILLLLLLYIWPLYLANANGF